MEAIGGINAFGGIGFQPTLADSGSEQRRRSSAAVFRNPRGRANTDATGLELSPEEKEQVRRLEQRDREVRAHEQAHQAAAGGLAVGGASFSFRQGPNGRMYAVGGEVNIDTSKEQNPEATMAKARRIRAAANAPAEPSAQDKSVAAEASRMEAEARREKAEKQTGRSSIGGPASLSGPPELSGPAASVSGPPLPLNRRRGELGTGGRDDVDGPFSAEDYRRRSRNRADAAAEAAQQAAAYQAAADEAYYAQQAVARADAAAAWQAMQDQAYAARMAADAAYYAQAAQAAALPELQPIDATRATGPAVAMAAGVYPLDRPPGAIFAARDLPGARTSAAEDMHSASPRSAAAAAVQTPAALTEPSPMERQRAARAYRRVGHVPTSLAPFGTGISQSV